MQSPISKARLWTARALSLLAVLFLLFDAVSHILMPGVVKDAFAHLGYPLSTGPALGVVALLLVALYSLPRTAVIAAVLLTGYLGGAVATHVRVNDPVFDTIFPILFSMLIWGGLFLRDPRVRSLISTPPVLARTPIEE